MTEWGYSQLIFTEKKIMFIHNVQAMLLQSERVSEMHFPAIWRPEFQKTFFPCTLWGYLTETVNWANYKKKLDLSGKTAADKSA